MHPARSVIFFTTASGAGYGLLALLGICGAFGLLPASRPLGAVGASLAIVLITAGLLASTAHLSYPERAWRAFSQWRSSWLSREGVASVLTYLPALAFAFGWAVLGRLDGWVAVAGLLAAAGAALTVSMTGMIYASLKPVVEWHAPYTVPGYLIFATMTGITLLDALLQGFGLGNRWLIVVAGIATLVGWVHKRAAWHHVAEGADRPTLNSATGLGEGEVRSVQWPHTERNYLLKEMGFRVARRHSARLRRLVHLLGFAAPLVLFVAAFFLPPAPAIAACLVAVPVQLAGVMVERWLFFAEATHTVTLYYGLA